MNSKNTPDKNENNNKSKKKKGFIRFEAVIPVLILIAASIIYYTLFFDSNFKSLLEFSSSRIYGAEVNIQDLKTSFRKASLNIDGIQITDIDYPEKNIIEIETISTAFSWDALLRAKFVIDDVTIKQIQSGSPRKEPGTIYRSKEDTGDFLEGSAKNVLTNTQEQFVDNVLGNTAALLSGVDSKEIFKNIQSQLKTKKKIDEIQDLIKSKEKEWADLTARLPSSQKTEDLKKRMNSLKFDTKKPVELAASIKEGQTIINEAESSIKSIAEVKANFDNDINLLKSELQSLEQAKNEDLNSLNKFVKIPELDPKTIAILLFGEQAKKYLAKINKYKALADEYFPQDTPVTGTSTESAIAPKKRKKGKNYTFPTTKTYPLFWLKEANISSVASADSIYSGNIEGKLTNATSDPVQLGIPTKLNLKGDFPQQNILGVDALITIDYTTEIHKGIIQATVSSFPIQEKVFSNSDDVQFIIKKATGSSVISGKIEQSVLQLNISNKISNIDYLTKAKTKAVETILTQVAKDTPIVNVSTDLTGQWNNPKIDIRTNLASAIQKSISRQVQAKIDETRSKFQAELNKLTTEQKAKVQSEIDKAIAPHKAKITEVTEQFNKAKKDIQAKIDNAKNQQKKQLEEKAKKGLGDLIKGIKF